VKPTTNYLYREFLNIQRVAVDNPKVAVAMGQHLIRWIDQYEVDGLSINILSIRSQIEKSINRIRKESDMTESEIQHIKRLAVIL